MPTFIAETGAALVNATSLASVAFATDYLSVHPKGSVWSALADDATRETHLMRATRKMQRDYAGMWQGDVVSLNQALDHPRFGMYNANGVYIDSATVADAIAQACCELALASAIAASATETDLDPELENSGSVKRERFKVDVIETETEWTIGAEADQIVRPRVDRLLAPFFKAGAVSSGGSSRASRA